MGAGAEHDDALITGGFGEAISNPAIAVQDIT
jgi:hypothetical protein